MKISTEEAFATPALLNAYRKIIEDGAPDDPGLALHMGSMLDPAKGWGGRLVEALPELGPIRIKAMDDSGVDMQLIFITAPGVQVFDADTGTALAAESNDILAEAINKNPTRFAGLSAIAPQAPEAAVREIERGIKLGMKGVAVNSHTKGEYLDATGFRPILEALESLDQPLYLHPTTVPTAMTRLFSERHMDGAFWGFQTETGFHALRLMVSGVFDEFPNLKIVLGHCGEGIPFWLDRLDRQYGAAGTDRFPRWRGKRLPSEYFQDNFYITTSGHNWDPCVRFVEEIVGEDRLMFAIDYPYADCQQQIDQAAAIELKNPDKFYHLNAQRVFKLN